MSALDRAYDQYAEEARRMARLERDPKATPRLRRLQAHAVLRAWWAFLEAGRPSATASIQDQIAAGRGRLVHTPAPQPRTLWEWLTGKSRRG